MEWRYQGQDYTEQHDPSLYGFTYIVHFENESGDVFSYYGKKSFTRDYKRNFGKKEIELMTDKRKKTYERIKKENDWKTYTGSSKETECLIPIYKEIIEFGRSNRELTYLEVKLLFTRSALEDESCINGNILGKFFRSNLV